MNYPKALYQGTLDNRIMHVAQDEKHEQALRGMGCVSFDELTAQNDLPQDDEQDNAQDDEQDDGATQKRTRKPKQV